MPCQRIICATCALPPVLFYGASATDITTDIVGMRGLASGGDPYPLLGPELNELGLQWDLDFYSPRPPMAFPFTAPVAFFPWRISLPIDGSCEEINARTKKPGHFAAIMTTLDLLRAYPEIDVKLCTPVTRHNFAVSPISSNWQKITPKQQGRVSFTTSFRPFHAL